MRTEAVKIELLDDSTINKIAAGEVVERPASVVKELVENAIDAGATRVEVEIMAGGTSFIRVTDNGCGMSAENAKMAILRHATSKIRAVSDLSTLGTLGFRGEALPTIASVSRFSMRTREAGAELGTSVTIEGGKPPEIREIGCSLGTTIQVEDLFFNTPARKKFLKTNHTEAGKISDFLAKLALSHAEIAFHFINNNKPAMQTPGNGNLYDAVQGIYGMQTAEALLGLSLENAQEEIRVRGYITKPSMLRSSRAWQSFIVNGRIVQSRALSKAVDNAYRSLIPKTGFPFVVAILELPQNKIDVNVHPQKTELKFEDESLVFKAVYKAVLDAIRPAGQDLSALAAAVEKAERHAAYTGEEIAFRPAAIPPRMPHETVRQESLQLSEAPRSAQATGGDVRYVPPRTIHEALLQGSGAIDFSEARREIRERNTAVYPAGQEDMEGRGYFSAAESMGAADTAYAAAEGTSGAWGEGALSYAGRILPIGQVDLTYIIAQDERGLYIVDQHAAHERILFDRFGRATAEIPAQQMLVHPVLTFDAKEAEMVETYQEVFEGLGFGLAPCGGNDFRLTEIPADIPLAEAEEVVREILMELGEEHRITAKEIRRACLAVTACRAAIKAGEELNLRQMEILLEELSNTDFPYTCPHGRPTILKFSTEELAKMFKRTGF